MPKALKKTAFDPSPDDLRRICRFFSIGELEHFKKDKDLIIPHRNPFIFATTTQGPFAIKFYPVTAARTIAAEYALNRILIDRRFPTPAMHPGTGGRPFLAVNGRLAACFTYIKGPQAWQHIQRSGTIHQINAALLCLKNILSTARGNVAVGKCKGLAAAIKNALAENAHAQGPEQKKIESYLLNAFQTYQRHRRSFTRQKLHTHANLCNFLIHKKTVYLLDLEHIREDYVLADLASLVMTSLLLGVPAPKIKAIVKDYFTQHKIKTDFVYVLDTLLKVRLVEDYFISDLSRKRLILTVLRKMNDPSTFIV
jgi:hypothetical protein